MDAHLVARLEAAVYAQFPGRFRQTESLQPAGRGQKAALRIFGVQACLDGMTVSADLVLRERQGFTRGDAELPFDEVEPGDHLGNGMLDLQARVHLEEIEALTVVQELDGTRTLVSRPRAQQRPRRRPWLRA